jgi:ASCH domain-containing protein
MKALSVRQPWAWLIVNGYKEVENRDWATKPKKFRVSSFELGKANSKQQSAVSRTSDES